MFIHHWDQEWYEKNAFLNSPEKDKIINMAYICILQDILDIDNRFHMLAQEVKNFFSKYYDMINDRES